jgi:hypothetical protein
MQAVTFVNAQLQPIATYNMDVPSVGDSVVLNGQAGNVQAVRFLLYPNGAVRVAVIVTPLMAAGDALVQHYNSLAPGK